MNTRITKTEIRRRLKSAKSAADKLLDDIEFLVSNRAWEILGYSDFSAMWEGENGTEANARVKYAAVYAFIKFNGVNTAGPGQRQNGPTHPEIGKAIGYRSSAGGGNTTVQRISKQYLAGVPLDEVSAASSRVATQRARSQPRRMGKNPNELINCGWSVYKYQVDAVKEIARKAGVPDSVVVRSALDAYLQGKIGKVS